MTTVVTTNDILPHQQLGPNPFLNTFAWFGANDRLPAFHQNSNLLQQIASTIANENWGEGYHILSSYLEQTFKRVVQQGFIEYSIDFKHACFNTGLHDSKFEDIYFVFEQNFNWPNKVGAPRYTMARPNCILKRYYVTALQIFGKLPPRAQYFDDPYDLLFDHRIEINAQLDHVLDEKDSQQQLQRIIAAWPDIGQVSQDDRVLMWNGALDMAKKRCMANIRTLVPQFFRDKNSVEGAVQLLMPVVANNQVIVVVPLQRVPRTRTSDPDPRNPEHWWYQASTVLTPEFAYKNARLLFRIESDWLVAPKSASDDQYPPL